jgi:hypothetical protein
MPNVLFPSAGSQKVAPLWPSFHALADEGSLFIVSSTDAVSGKAAGTGIATTTSVVDDAATASATHAQNVPVMYLYNKASVSDPLGKSIYPLWMRFLVTAAPTSATVWNWALRADYTTGGRYTSGGTALSPINVNTGSSNQSAAQIIFGAVVTPLPGSSQRVLGSGQVQSSIPVVKDMWMFTFGDNTMPTNVLTASAAKNITIPCGPVIIAPGVNITLEMWGASCAGAPAWEFEMGYAERVSGQ